MHSASVSPRRSRRARLAITAVFALAAVAALGVSALAQGKQGRAAAAPSISSKPWGTVGGKAVNLYTLSNGSMKVNITNFGGIIQSIYAPDRNGKLTDVTLGFANLKGYEANDATKQPTGGSGTTYFGSTVGRYANRIANGKFTLNGKTYHLPVNNGPNTLHGGTNSWNKEVWAPKTSTAGGAASLQLTLTSPNGQDGFPGTVVAQVTFSLGATNKLTIQYHATTDKPTVINMTNHSYFNLGGEASGTVYGQKLMINADKITPTDDTQIPTGKIVSVAGGPFDFRHLTPIGQNINTGVHQLILAHGYDDNWIINGGGSKLTLAAKAEDPVSGRTLTAYTTEPGVQVYTGNYLVGELKGTSGHLYRQGDGFTLETQHYPDSPNQPTFPTTTLNPGTPFNSTTVFAFSTTK
jgi:aldose 1-epimerase